MEVIRLSGDFSGGGILSMISFIVPNYFQLSQSAFYFIFFLLGIYTIIYRKTLLRIFTQKKVLIVSLLGYVLTFIVGTLIIARLTHLPLGSGLIGKAMTLVAIRVCMIPYIISGMIVVYGLANRWIRSDMEFPRWVVGLNSMCFGIYIVQQFILKILYYKTSLPAWAGNIWLPVLGCVVTLGLSVAIVYCFRKIPPFRQLIG